MAALTKATKSLANEIAYRRWVYTCSHIRKEIIVVGDLNCDLLKPDSPEAMSLLDFCTSVNQTQLIKEPTRVTETSSSLIDIIMTSNVSLVENHGVDHYLTYASLKLKMLKPPPSYKCVRSYKNYKPDSFLADLQRIP